MSVDPYAPCPCGSGKKLKFCCSDLVHEIEKIDKLIHADQPRAALARCEQLLTKEPNRASLLDLAAMLKLSLEDVDGAAAIVQTFLAAHPDSPTAHAQAALVATAREDAATAVGELQSAFEHCGNDLPQRVFEAIGAVGHALLLAGDLVAARAHLLMYAGLAPNDDNEAVELLLRLNLQSGLPLLLREPLTLVKKLADPPKPIAADFAAAMELAQRGRWRQAAAAFETLRDQIGSLPAVVYNLALCRGWSGDKEGFVDALHDYAALDVPYDDAVEAEALAQLVLPREDAALIETLCLSYHVEDADVAAERLLADKRVEIYPVDPETFKSDEDTPPRETYILLDRPVATAGVDIELGQIPNVLAFLSLYGKRTDRPAQLKVTTDDDQLFTVVTGLVTEIVGDALGSIDSRETLAEKSASEEALSWRWRLPDDTPSKHRRQLLAERRRRAILDDWTSAPLGNLGDLSPEAAASQPELQVRLAAAVLIIEQASADPAERSLFDELRSRLGLPAAEPIDPATIDWQALPMVRVPRLELAALDAESLSGLLDRCTLAGAPIATLAVATELAGRDEPLAVRRRAFQQLVRKVSHPDAAIPWIEQAKTLAASEGAKLGEWLLMELQVHMERGDFDGIQAALRAIGDREAAEPEAAQAAYRILYQSGLIAPPGERTDVAEAPLPVASGSKLWTPDGDAPAPAGPAKSAIWTP
ncbi:MAG: hypothetical protein KF688_12250 [Pirellulales bacterium]|nr:hypothetical protein [Pirellulales bacterium]